MALGTKIDSVNVLYGACGDAEEIYRRDDYSDIADLNPRAAKALLSKELENASAVVAQCDRKGVGILTYDDPLFPSRLKALAAPPTVLYYKGTLRRLDDECVVGMVGTRSMTDYGRNVTYAFAKSLAAGNTVIVSGLAAGIDATAHKGALDAGGYSVAVLGTPIDRVYPMENYELFGEMEKRGVIFSEYYPGCRTTGACFPIRNRIIAGLSCALIVCEAGARSGALITARDAVMQGKPVFAIPGPAGSATNVGTNEMLKKGARMAARPYDVLSSLELAYPDKIHIRGDAFTMGESEPPKAPVTAPRTVKAAEAKSAKEQTPQRKQQKKPLVGQTLDDLTETERRVMNAIDTDGTTADTITVKTGLSVSEVMSTLTLLEIYGRVRSEAGGIFIPNI